MQANRAPVLLVRRDGRSCGWDARNQWQCWSGQRSPTHCTTCTGAKRELWMAREAEFAFLAGWPRIRRLVEAG
ncbi:MAG: hypothetical protein M3P04_05005 [Actinomycetota bacterium]|nr:hypothetical protein [Actinomycetota bacterium]